jgi:hypothetical protein
MLVLGLKTSYNASISIGTKPIRLDVEKLEFWLRNGEKSDQNHDLGREAYTTWNQACAFFWLAYAS